MKYVKEGFISYYFHLVSDTGKFIRPEDCRNRGKIREDEKTK